MKNRFLRAALLGALVLTACASSDRKKKEEAVAPPVADPVRAFVAHRDARLGAPSFVWLSKQDGVRFESAAEAASVTLHGLVPTFGLSPAALSAVSAPELHDMRQAGAVIARYKQRVFDVDVFRASLAISMNAAFEPVSASGLLAKSLAGADRPFTRDRRTALADAYAAMVGDTTSFTAIDVHDDYELFTSPVLGMPARVKKVFYPYADGVEPAYYVEIELARGAPRTRGGLPAPAWSFVVSATDGRVLFANDLVKHDAFTYRVYASAETQLPFDGPQGNGYAPHPTGLVDGMKPVFGSTELVTLQNFPFSKNDPWLPPGATTTSGNNVRAYADLLAPDGIGGDAFPAPTSESTWDYQYDTSQSPGATPTSTSAAAVHLFYVTNFLHDWYYDAGYDEKSGNHQTENFGRGGTGRDPLRAEAQDYGGRNNADATVPSDGASPRIQMYVFSGPSAANLTVTAPANIAGVKAVGLAGFGNDQFDVAGSVALAVDDSGDADACEPLATNVSGKIVLAHRGTCSFVQKAQNVQAAGGIGVIIANVASSAQPTIPPFMGGTSGAISIPILSLALADGVALQAAIPAGATVTMHRQLQTDLDGSLDTSIVAHEWGHVLSSRLVGDGNGLTTNQAGGLGEGWGDFTALLLMARQDDLLVPVGANWNGAYSKGAYATLGQGSDYYFGIRRVPYSVDQTKDPLTFKHIANGTPLPSNVPISFGEDGSFNAEVHSTGEVWATMLWECYVALLRDPRHTFAQAQEKMKRYLVASLKLTPPDPTLLEGRDALLAAAFAVDEKDFRAFWEAFGRRGAGVGAEGPPKDSTSNQGVKESYFVGNDVQIADAKIVDDVISCDHDGIMDDGEIGTITMTVRNAGPGALAEPTAKLSSSMGAVAFPDGDSVKLAPLKPFETTKVTVLAQIKAGEATKPFTIDVAVSDPSFGEGRVQKIGVETRYNADEEAESSTIDRVDTTKTSWSVSTDDTTSVTKRWSRVTSGFDGKWVIPNNTEAAEHRLTSPKFTIEGTTFELSFKHRHSFRFSTRRMADIDGGVVEVSTDGRTWKDISTFGAVDYNTTLSTTGRGDNPLKGRKAYGNRSKGYPDAWITSRIAVDLKEHPEAVQIRFLVGTGTGFTGAPGWEIDEIALDGITSKPFWGFVPHADYCDERGPVVSAGEGKTVKPKSLVVLQGSGSHPEGLPITFVWSQETGPLVTMKDDGSGRLELDAPDVLEPVTLRFALRAHDGALLSPASRVEVAVTAPDPTDLSASGAACGCKTAGAPSPATPAAAGLGALALLALRRRRR
ncbi:MAG: M36 family metallopeptidase [Labilithrix sp.]|nr:M36 family metallopeptidase [Labilithrix sp.]